MVCSTSIPAATFSAISFSSLPPISGTLTLISSSTTSRVPPPSSSRRMVPAALAGLPGDSMLRLPVVGPSQTSRWIACVDSPANVRANPGRSLVFCCWSMTRVNPSPVAIELDVRGDHLHRRAGRLPELRVGQHLEHLVGRRVVRQLVAELHAGTMA